MLLVAGARLAARAHAGCYMNVPETATSRYIHRQMVTRDCLVGPGNLSEVSATTSVQRRREALMVRTDRRGAVTKQHRERDPRRRHGLRYLHVTYHAMLPPREDEEPDRDRPRNQERSTVDKVEDG